MRIIAEPWIVQNMIIRILSNSRTLLQTRSNSSIWNRTWRDGENIMRGSCKSSLTNKVWMAIQCEWHWCWPWRRTNNDQLRCFKSSWYATWPIPLSYIRSYYIYSGICPPYWDGLRILTLLGIKSCWQTNKTLCIPLDPSGCTWSTTKLVYW